MALLTWIILPLLCGIVATIYLYHKIKNAITYLFSAKNLKFQRLLTIALSILLVIPAIKSFGMWFIIIIHFTVMLIITDIIVFFIKKIRKNNTFSNFFNAIYKTGLIAILLTAIIISYGRFNIFNVIKTSYTIRTEKNMSENGYKILMLSDLHYGVSLNNKQLQATVNRMNNEKPDFVVLDGDIVDESTTRKQMEDAFRILGNIKSTYGTYYVYGNHDKNNYTSSPNYSPETLAQTIKASGIKILEDDTISIDNSITLIGRADRVSGEFERSDISTLTANLDSKQLWIVLDHQPAEYSEVKEAGCDIILSGHTHAGQIWPLGVFSSVLHLDDLNYGMIKSNKLNAIVTSGIAGWGFPIRTEKHSEYVVINILPL